MTAAKQPCRRCGYRVAMSPDDYETFERMHVVCFHQKFKHRSGVPDNDPDEDCGLLNCPSAPGGTAPRPAGGRRDGAWAAWDTDHTVDGTRSSWEVATKAMRAATTYEQ